jgi:hypothetical protein
MCRGAQDWRSNSASTASRIVVGLGAGRNLAGQVRQRMEQIGAADDPDQRSAAHDRDALDSVLLHDGDDLGEFGVFRDGPDVGRHHFVYSAGVRLYVVLGEHSRPEKEFDPARALALGAGLGAAQKITFSDDARHSPVLVDHRQAADPMLQHQPQRFEDRGVRRDGDHVPGHYVPGFHRRPPLSRGTEPEQSAPAPKSGIKHGHRATAATHRLSSPQDHGRGMIPISRGMRLR